MQSFIKAFRRNADGSWTCIEHATYEGPLGRIQVAPGSTFSRGTRFMNVDLTELLDEQAAREPPPQASS